MPGSKLPLTHTRLLTGFYLGIVGKGFSVDLYCSCFIRLHFCSETTFAIPHTCLSFFCVFCTVWFNLIYSMLLCLVLSDTWCLLCLELLRFYWSRLPRLISLNFFFFIFVAISHFQPGLCVSQFQARFQHSLIFSEQ